ncbi:hypothetical protein JB92DRAFT_432525 [Gautieria morchelliformis]|nr:hypothetical protein JB92DRAFT_432525 [Gautieria morchelliformis]
MLWLHSPAQPYVGLGAVPYTCTAVHCTATLRPHPYRMLGCWNPDGTDTAVIRPSYGHTGFPSQPQVLLDHYDSPAILSNGNVNTTHTARTGFHTHCGVLLVPAEYLGGKRQVPCA